MTPAKTIQSKTGTVSSGKLSLCASFFSVLWLNSRGAGGRLQKTRTREGPRGRKGNNMNTEAKTAREKQIYAYCRVSTREQNLDRQVIAMKEFGVKERNIFTEKVSGKNFDRPVFLRLVRRLKKGDTLVVKSIDRLGRNYREIQDQWRVITKDKGAESVVIDTPILDTRQRQAEGIAAAKVIPIRPDLSSFRYTRFEGVNNPAILLRRLKLIGQSKLAFHVAAIARARRGKIF